MAACRPHRAHAHPGSPNDVIARAAPSACQHRAPAASCASESASALQLSPRPTTLTSTRRPPTPPPPSSASRFRRRDGRDHSACHSPLRSGRGVPTAPVIQDVRRTSVRKRESWQASSCSSASTVGSTMGSLEVLPLLLLLPPPLLLLPPPLLLPLLATGAPTGCWPVVVPARRAARSLTCEGCASSGLLAQTPIWMSKAKVLGHTAFPFFALHELPRRKTAAATTTRRENSRLGWRRARARARRDRLATTPLLYGARYVHTRRHHPLGSHVISFAEAK